MAGPRIAVDRTRREAAPTLLPLSVMVPLATKAPAAVDRMRAALGPVRLQVRVPVHLEQVGVDALATDFLTGGGRGGAFVRALIWRHDRTPGAIPVDFEVYWAGASHAVTLDPCDVAMVGGA